MIPTLAAAALMMCGQNSPVHRTGASGAHGSLLERWIDALARAESGNRAWIVHQDRDGRYYYGCLQFRASTFRYYVEKFGLASDGAEDSTDLIYDCSFQKRLAARMIRDNPENWRHWKTTVERIGLPPVMGDARSGERRASAGQTTGEVK